MQNNKTFTMSLLLIILGLMPIFASVQIGMKMTNNQMNDNWLLTPAPELELSGRRFALTLDGTIGNAVPSNDADGFILFSRISIVPMIQLRLARFSFNAGYGISNIYRHEELHGADGNLSITSGQNLHGEIRTSLSFRIPMNPAMALLCKTGYSYLDSHYQFVSAGLGVEFRIARSETAGSVPKNEAKAIDRIPKSASSPLPSSVRAEISQICIIENPDKIADELNSAIEVALIQAGFRITSWNKILMATDQQISPGISNESNDINTSDQAQSGIRIVLQNYRRLGISTAIETSLRYTFKAYGGDVLVQSAYVKVSDLATGTVLWATDFNVQDASFSRCKQKLSEQTVKAIKQFK